MCTYYIVMQPVSYAISLNGINLCRAQFSDVYKLYNNEILIAQSEENIYVV